MTNRSRGRGQISELTHIAPIKQGFIDPPVDGSHPIRYADRLRTLLEAFHAREDQGFPSVIRLFRGLHTAQWALLDGDTRLMVNVVFDGQLHGYLRALARDIPGMLHLIWSNCDGWQRCDERPQNLIDFIERHQVRVNFFYSQNPSLSVPDVENLLRLREAFESDATAAGQAYRQQLQARLYRENAPRSNAQRLEALLGQYGDVERSQQAFLGLFGSLYNEQELDAAGRETYGGCPPKPDPSTADTQRENKIQSSVLDSYERAHCGRMLFFHFPDAQAAREWLHEQRERLSYGRQPGTETYLNLGFTYQGLAALGLDRAVLSGFPAAFCEGMDARADALGDPPPSAHSRTHWTHEREPNKPIHAVLFVNCRPGDELRKELLIAGQIAQAYGADDCCEATTSTSGDVSGHHTRLTRELGAHLDHVCAEVGLDVALQVAAKAPQLVGYQDLHRPLVDSGVKSVGAYGIEYFGFRDGIGQPALPSSTPLAASAVGSSGWLKERASYDVVLRSEPTGLLKNATFLVARQLRQDPEAFWETMRTQAQAVGLNKRELAEQILGRRMDGRRLDSTQDHFDADRDRLAFDPDRETPSCPFHSHVRRSNPRTETSPARNPQLMRRSLAYLNPRGDDYAKGLMFMAFNADIETQFELIQRNWIQAGNQVGLTSRDRDALVGLQTAPKPHLPTSPARFYAEAAPDSRELRFEKAFVTLEWGVYLYFPARDALNRL